MATMDTISEALKLIPQKRLLLRQAFEDLQSNSSFSLSWSDVDSHFSSLQATAEAKFKLLQSQPLDETPKSQPHPKIEPKSLDKVEVIEIEPPPLDKVKVAEIEPPPSDKVEERAKVKARPEVKALCKKMDGLGLRNYISLHRSKERQVIGDELPHAFKCANDAAAMVLDALDCFLVPNLKCEKDLQLLKIREACIVLFKGLMYSKVEISPEVRERAKNLGLDWKGKVRLDDIDVLEPYGFLYLVAIYGLVDVFSINDLFDMAAIVAARFWVAAPLIRLLSFGDKISELIQKIINKGKQLQAVRYVLEFELAGKFPPVALLQDYVNELKNNTLKAHKDGTPSLQLLNDSTYKEICALRTVLNLIEDNKIEAAEFLKERVRKRIDGLEQQMARRKKKKPVPLKYQSLSGIKRPRVTPSVAFASSADIPTIPTSATTQPHIYNENSTVQAYQQSNPQLLPNGTLNVASTTSSNVPPYQHSFVQPNVTIVGEAVPNYQQSYSQPASSLSNTHTQYLNPQVASLPITHTQYSGSQVAAYGSAGATSVTPYANSSDGTLYGSASTLPNTHTQYSGSQVSTYGSAGAASVTPYANSSDGTLYGSASSLPNTHIQYSSSQVAAYGSAGTTSVTPSASSSAGVLYGSSEAPLPHVPAHQLDPSMASVYSHQPDPNMASGYSLQPDPNVTSGYSHQPDPNMTSGYPHQPDPNMASGYPHQPDPNMASGYSHQPNPKMAAGHSHQPDPNMASGYYAPANYGGYAMPPQHYPSYQPQ